MSFYWICNSLLASAGNEAVARTWEGLSIGRILWQIFVILFCVLLNGFFVAAEFALVKVRSSQLEALEAAGNKSARLARHLRENLDTYLSANQLGITLASIALGFLGEAYVMRLIQPVFFFFMEEPAEALVRGTSFVLAYSTVTFLHVTIGEQAPKIIGIQKAARITLLASRPLYLFYQVLKPAIWLVNESSNFLLRSVFRLEPSMTGDKHHSAEELAILVAESGESAEVTETERDILINALELNDLTVRDIMTPRNEVVCLDPDQPFEQNVQTAVDSRHTRFPLSRGHLDETLGLIHIKDMLTLIGESKQDFTLIKRDLLPVPEMMPLDRLLKFFLNRHAHLALVVDEFGGSVGIVTLDNVLEELVGDIQDEFDVEEKEFARVSDDVFLVEGTLGIYELSDFTELTLEDPEVSTVGGYVTHVLGHLPKVGETVEIEGYEVTITKTDGRRVVQMKFARKSSSKGSAAGGGEREISAAREVETGGEE